MDLSATGSGTRRVVKNNRKTGIRRRSARWKRGKPVERLWRLMAGLCRGDAEGSHLGIIVVLRSAVGVDLIPTGNRTCDTASVARLTPGAVRAKLSARRP